MDVQVLAPTVQEVNLSLELAAQEGASFETVKAAVEGVISTFFNGRMLGKAGRLAELGSKIFAVEGVENYRFTDPSADRCV